MKRAGSFMIMWLLGIPLNSLAEDQKPVSIEEIRTKWQQQQDSAKTFRLSWEQSVFFPSGGFGEVYLDEKVRFPVADITLKENGSILMDNVKAKFQFEGYAYSARDKSFVEHKYEAIYDGKTGAIIRDGVEAGVTVVNLQSGRRPPRLTTTSNIPILRSFRPSSLEFGGYDLDKFIVTGRVMVINGVNCLELALKSPPQGVKTLLWLAKEQQYHVVRSQQLLEQGSCSLIQYDVRYFQQSNGMWVPESWNHITKSRSGRIVSSTKATVKECEILGRVDTETFTIKAPAKSRVTEYDINDSPQKKYITRPDGSQREILPGEDSMGYQQLVDTQPGELLEKPSSWFSRNWITVLGVIFVLCGLVSSLYLVTRRRVS